MHAHAHHTCSIGDKRPDDEDILFTCSSQGDGLSPSCDMGPLMDSMLAGSCVKNTITGVLDEWVLGVSN